MYSISFTVSKKKFCLSLHYNEANSYLFVNGTEIYKFKAKGSEIVASPLCLGKYFKRFIAGFTSYIYDFSFGYYDIAVNDIENIDKYLIQKNNIIWIH